MVKDVTEDALEFNANALRHQDVLLDAEVQIPVGQAAETASAAILVIYAQNRVTPVVGISYPILERIDGQRV
jgi:hypothetical protein